MTTILTTPSEDLRVLLESMDEKERGKAFVRLLRYIEQTKNLELTLAGAIRRGGELLQEIERLKAGGC